MAAVQGYPDGNSVRPHEEGEDVSGLWYGNEVKDGLVAGLDVEAEYQTTKDGEFLLFGPYRYDAGDDSVVCVMCYPDGSGPVPGAGFGRSDQYSDNPAGRPTRGMSENGEYVFFDTEEPLVPQATNGKVNVYEWHEGQGISLIGSGQDPHDTFFLDSSSFVGPGGEVVEGGNVFFGTHAQLVPQDTDEEGDLYDARIDGGFPVQPGVLPCEGDACDNPPPPPFYQTPATSTSSSTGNVVSKPPSGAKKKTKKKTTRKDKRKQKRKKTAKAGGGKVRRASDGVPSHGAGR